MVYVGMTLLLGFAAVNTGNNLLYLLVSALLGFMAVSGWLGQQNLRKLRVQLRLPAEVFAGQPTLIGLTLSNQRKRLPAFLIRATLRDSDLLFAQTSARASTEQSLMLNWPARGAQQVESLWLESCFPINFFVRSIRIPINQSVLVFPQPLSGKIPAADGQNSQTEQQSSILKQETGDFRGIHDYRGGEPLRSIHWKLSARHENFKVKEHEGLGGQPLMIDLALLSGSLETRLSHATRLIIDQIRRQRPVGLKLSNQLIAPQIGMGHRRRLLAELALYHGG